MLKSVEPLPPEGPPRRPAVAFAEGASDTQSRDAMRAAVERELEERAEKKCVPPPIPDHVLLQRIGRGAYGEVWLARNALGTLRAVKVVYRARFENERPYEREFSGILKYEPVSRSHEGLIQVLHVGRNDEAGCFYYVMELGDDLNFERTAEPKVDPGRKMAELQTYNPRTLGAELDKGQRLPAIEAGQLVARLASALVHLHARGLVHRDIKPSNVIFVGGQPKLADIGLVTDIGSSRTFVGTEGFVPPEGPGTPQADIYALGKLFYELATGLDRMEFPQLPARVAQLPDGEALLELNEVITRACAPDPQQRHPSAQEFQAEINLFLAGRSLRRARNVERHLVQLKRVALSACAFGIVAAIVLWFSMREERVARARARAATERARVEAALRLRAEAAEHDSQQQLYTALLEQARATVRSGELGRRVNALAAARHAAAISNTAELRREVLAALTLPDLRLEREWSIGPDLTMARLDPQFQRMAVIRRRGPVEIRSVTDGRVIIILPASTNLISYAGLWSRDGRFLAIKRDYGPSGHRGDLEIWEPASSRRVMLVRDIRWNAWSFHPRKPELLTAGTGGLVVAWDLEEGKELARRTFQATLRQLVHSPDGNRIATSYQLDKGWGVSIHDVAEEMPLASHLFPNAVSGIDWDPNGRWISVPDGSGKVHLMDSRTGEIRTLGHHKAEAVTTTFDPDGRYLISGGWERELICWDLCAMERAFVIGLDSFQAQFSADGRHCAVSTRSGVHLHTFERPTLRGFAEDLGPRLRHAAISPNGRWLAASADKRLGLWDLASTGPGALADEGAEARPFFTADSQQLFGSGDTEAFRWRIAPADDAKAPPRLQRLNFQTPRGFTSLCVVSNAVALTSSHSTQLLTSDTPSLGKPTSAGNSGASSDGRWLGIYQPFSTLLNIYQLPELESVAQVPHPASIGGFKFSPLGDEVAIASLGQVEFWSTANWQRTRVITNFTRILFAPDARTCWLIKDYFASAGLYDTRTLEPLLPLPAGMLPLALSADGRHLVVSVDARRLHVWDVAEVREQLRELSLDWAHP